MKPVAWLLLLVAACGGTQTVESTSDQAAASADAGEPDANPAVAAIEYAMNANGAAIYACGKRARAAHLDLSGELVLAGQFGDMGRLATLKVTSDTTGNSIVAGCLIELFLKHDFGDSMGKGDQVLLPFRFVAPDAQYTVDSRDVVSVRERKGLITPRNSGNPNVTLMLFEVPDGDSLVLHEMGGIRVVLSGGGTWGTKDPAPPGSALYALGLHEPFADKTDGVPTQLLVLNVLSAKGDKRVVRSVEDGQALSIAGGKAVVNLYFDAAVVGGDKAAYMGLLDAEPGMQVPEHVHAGETEVLYILAGEGMMTVDGNPEPVKQGYAVQIPPGTKHSFVVTGDKRLQAVQFYTPSGPEQRFKP